MTRAPAVAAAALLVSALQPVGVAGAPPSAQTPVVLSGQVVDTYWGRPVEGALVMLSETRRPDGSQVTGITNADGRFSIADVPAGPSQVSVSRIGYADLVQVLDIREGISVEIAVIPKPVVLEGIEVYVDRLESRLRTLPHASATFTETDLKMSPDLNVADYLDSRPGFEFVPCFQGGASEGLFNQRRDCMRARGTTPQRPRIFVDDAPAFGGVQELASLPSAEVYRIEVIRGCGQIRIYTISFSEGTAIRPRPLLPIVC